MGGFLERNNLSDEGLSLEEVVNELQKFLLPVFESINYNKEFEKR
ncbi:MAG: hypothetical protein V5A79_07580 [Candidatus Bipolaricaulota bacterium]